MSLYEYSLVGFPIQIKWVYLEPGEFSIRITSKEEEEDIFNLGSDVTFSRLKNIFITKSVFAFWSWSSW